MGKYSKKGFIPLPSSRLQPYSLIASVTLVMLRYNLKNTFDI